MITTRATHISGFKLKNPASRHYYSRNPVFLPKLSSEESDNWKLTRNCLSCYAGRKEASLLNYRLLHRT
jgi:hypothetical protein